VSVCVLGPVAIGTLLAIIVELLRRNNKRSRLQPPPQD